jgi:hypothetical protein
MTTPRRQSRCCGPFPPAADIPAVAAVLAGLLLIHLSGRDQSESVGGKQSRCFVPGVSIGQGGRGDCLGASPPPQVLLLETFLTRS